MLVDSTYTVMYTPAHSGNKNAEIKNSTHSPILHEYLCTRWGRKMRGGGEANNWHIDQAWSSKGSYVCPGNLPLPTFCQAEREGRRVRVCVRCIMYHTPANIESRCRLPATLGHQVDIRYDLGAIAEKFRAKISHRTSNFLNRKK